MKSAVESSRSVDASHDPREDSEDREVVLRELENVLSSRFFRSASRCKQFLSYVVEHKISGTSEQLKERRIGTDLFQRPPGYATGEDPVVRVQAGEVRRRLEQYYQANPNGSPVRIEMPLGSYSAVFQWHSTHPPIESRNADQSLSAIPDGLPKMRRIKPLQWVGTLFVVMLIASVALFLNRHFVAKQSVLAQFWSPVLATQQPALICLAKGVTYRPSLHVYQRYAQNHPSTFQSEVERSNVPLPLDANEQVSWSDMKLYPDYGVAAGDVLAAVKLSALLGKIGKPTQVRIGANYSFEDLRNSPAVIVGAFNNKWTMQLTSSLHFAFVDRDGHFEIRENSPNGRTWETRSGNSEIPDDDFAIVDRLIDSKTGQFAIVIAGLTGSGTAAAGDFVANPEYLEKAIQSAPPGWQNKNLEIVLQTTVTDSVSGPPRIIAAYFW